MKKHLINSILLASGLFAASCGSPKQCPNGTAGDGVTDTAVSLSDDELMGAWAPIELSKDELVFPRKGGEATVICRNYGIWWINDVQVVGEDRVIHADPGKDNSYRTLVADGISAEIVDGNKVRITVDGNKEKRSWYLHMESGDAFTTIKIIKKGRE